MKWYEHPPLSLVENERVKLMWERTIFNDKRLESDRPDITLVHKCSFEWILIDVALPWNKNIANEKEEAKI